ncbi:hypothetical protein GGS20DRAFT_393122 [Poronia punctata]|nr:hypothetical protein GGS20DRAFT_393122 [Poronia punctata]
MLQQSVCSYIVYAGRNQEFVVQFRLKPLALDLETVSLAQEIYGSLTPEVYFMGSLAKRKIPTERSLYVYVMAHTPGISHLDFVISHDAPENSSEWFTWRNSLLTDIARIYLWAKGMLQTTSRKVPKQYERGTGSHLHHLIPACFRNIEDLLFVW